MAESGKGGMLRQVMQKVSKVFNRGLMRKDSSKKAEDLDVDNDFDPENDELPLSTRENILGRRDSRFIMADSFELRREFPGLDIKPRLIFDHPSIEQLSEAIVNLPKADVEPAVSEGTSRSAGNG
ncbi:Serine/threonine-protein kinase pkn1 [Durusdinium trenchii]|uniref:Serine/threonine-protein kinase pkn1 n=1 Tax=Durusdinium trenchii TaxID=1381693 RepID=A0ABP0I5N9_9DINO